MRAISPTLDALITVAREVAANLVVVWAQKLVTLVLRAGCARINRRVMQ